MKDKFGRQINYLRISVIDRCNLRCIYCVPENGIDLFPHKEILSLEEIISITKVATKLGFNKIRLTGGEPLLRKNIVYLVSELAKIKGINDLAMTTNGILLTKYAQELANAGLHRLNISLDSLDPEHYRLITRGGDIEQVITGIEVALKVGFPIKLNCVVTNNTQSKDISDLQIFADKRKIQLRLIQVMDFKTGTFTKVENKGGGDCKYCNRLRLLSDGKILPCLFSDNTFSIKRLGIREAFKQAVLNKPKSGKICQHKCMCTLGG